MEIRSVKTWENGNTVFSAKVKMPMDVLVKKSGDGKLGYMRTSESYINKDGEVVYRDCYFPADSKAVMAAIEAAVDAGECTSIGKEEQGILGYVTVDAEWWVNLTLTKNGKIALPQKVKKGEEKTRPVFWLEPEVKAEALATIQAELQKTSE